MPWNYHLSGIAVHGSGQAHSLLWGKLVPLAQCLCGKGCPGPVSVHSVSPCTPPSLNTDSSLWTLPLHECFKGCFIMYYTKALKYFLLQPWKWGIGINKNTTELSISQTQWKSTSCEPEGLAPCLAPCSSSRAVPKGRISSFTHHLCTLPCHPSYPDFLQNKRKKIPSYKKCGELLVQWWKNILNGLSHSLCITPHKNIYLTLWES